MTTITIQVNNRTKKGKQLLNLINRLAEEAHFIRIEEKPNAETLKVMEDARKSKGKEFATLDELFNELSI